MDTQIADLSDLLKERIADAIGAQRFKLWFKNATHFSVTGAFLKVGVPNHFIGGWIERHFSDVIIQAAREILKHDVQLTFVLEPSLVTQLPKPQFDSQAECVSKPQPTRGAIMTRRNPAAGRSMRGRLETFVVGSSNRMAYSAALAIAEQRPSAPHSLFVHGGCGLGKTHLLQGVANAVNRHTHTPTRWAYLSGEEFTNEFLLALKNRQLEQFRSRYRRLDLLLLDDVHFLANKKATQEEFLHTLNAIDTIGKRVVLASDAHPRMIGQLSESLVSRFVSGVVVKIESPDPATRCDILRRRAAEVGRSSRQTIPEAVIQYIAEKVRSNVRELEGALLRVLAITALSNTPVTLTMAQQALEEHISRSEPMVTAEQIESTVATYFGLTPADLHTSRKTQTIALARAIAMYMAREGTALSYPEIARHMGNKNHSTVLLACRRMSKVLAKDGDVRWQSAAGRKSGQLSSMLRDLKAQLRR